MNDSIKYLLITILVFVLIAMCVFLFILKAVDFDMDATINIYEIDFIELNEKVYISAKSWGLAGNHSEILLSTTPINNVHRKYLPNKQFTFLSCTELYYQKKGSDTLLLYVDYKSKVPENLSTRIKIIQVELKNEREFQNYVKNYKELGLSKVSVY